MLNLKIAAIQTAFWRQREYTI